MTGDDRPAEDDELVGCRLGDEEEDVERVERADGLDGDLVGVTATDPDQEESAHGAPGLSLDPE